VPADDVYLLLRERIVANVQRLMKAEGISKERLAANAGVGKSTIYAIETSTEGPQLMTLVRLAIYFKTSVVDLLSEPPRS